MPRMVAVFSCSVKVRMRLGCEQAVESQGLQQCLFVIHLVLRLAKHLFTLYQETKKITMKVIALQYQY